jgi:hypothetical protein
MKELSTERAHSVLSAADRSGRVLAADAVGEGDDVGSVADVQPVRTSRTTRRRRI